jgi:predicted nucleotide-binding protein
MIPEHKIKGVVEGIKQFQEHLREIFPALVPAHKSISEGERLESWKEHVVRFLKENVSEQEAIEFLNFGGSSSSLLDRASLYHEFLNTLFIHIEDYPDSLKQAGKYVFIGHGRNPIWARLQLFVEKDLYLPTICYESESRTGDSIVPILEKMLNETLFAVLILTAEDETATGRRRARQNVIHEAGLFQGKLGFKKAVLLKQEGIEEFTNVSGLQYIEFSENKIEQTFYELQRVLKREGVI